MCITLATIYEKCYTSTFHTFHIEGTIHLFSSSRDNQMTSAQLDETVEAITAFTVTELKERAREVIDLVAERKAIAILRHKVADAVLISASDYVEFVKLKRERLNFLTERYDEMVARMQAPESAAGVDTLFNATSEEMGRAAVAAAKRG
jgi:antitoxin Phd